MQFVHGPALPKCNIGRDSRLNLWYKLTCWSGPVGLPLARSPEWVSERNLRILVIRAKHVGEACAVRRGVVLCGEEV